MCTEGENILTWLLQREHRVDDSSCFEGEGDCRRREPQGLSEEKKEENVRNWKEKALYGEFVQQTSDIDGEDSWRWLRNGVLKKDTEGLIIAAQKQALRQTQLIIAYIRPQRHHCVDCVETPLKQNGILSVDARSSPRESIGSATTRCPCRYTGRCAESTG